MEPSNYSLPHEKQILEYAKTIEQLRKQAKDSPAFLKEVARFEKKLEELKVKVYKELSSWDRVLISRHPQRPHSTDYIQAITSNFIELHGDRTFRDDPAVVGGFCMLDSLPIMLIGQEKGADTEERMKRNFGMVCPEGFRKAMRLMKMAETFQIPIVTLLDTPGAYPGLEAEERGQGRVIAENLEEMFEIKVPIISLVIGEGCSGGALGMGIGDIIAMLEHSYYTVISPEGCASILWKDSSKKQLAADTLRLNAEHLLELGIVDDIIKEPMGGAHMNPQEMHAQVKQYLISTLRMLMKIPVELLLENRYKKFRSIGVLEESLL
jgi:acetyl-CoA carboxylase carboxyl transferase subunit alpha